MLVHVRHTSGTGAQMCTCIVRPMSRECHPARGHLFGGAGLHCDCNQFSTVLTSVIVVALVGLGAVVFAWSGWGVGGRSPLGFLVGSGGDGRFCGCCPGTHGAVVSAWAG